VRRAARAVHVQLVAVAGAHAGAPRQLRAVTRCERARALTARQASGAEGALCARAARRAAVGQNKQRKGRLPRAITESTRSEASHRRTWRPVRTRWRPVRTRWQHKHREEMTCVQAYGYAFSAAYIRGAAAAAAAQQPRA
jgi:hypothetical protein